MCDAAPPAAYAAFTLIELLIVVTLLGILTAIGVPTYLATIQRSYCRQAQDLLLTIYSGERVYYSRTSSYLALAPGDNWRLINLEDPNHPGSPVSFQVQTTGCSGTPCFLATVTQGSTTLLTIDQDRTLNSPSGRCTVAPISTPTP